MSGRVHVTAGTFSDCATRAQRLEICFETQINEDYDDWDGNIHTYTSGRRHRPRNDSDPTNRMYRKSRSHSFSEQPTKKTSTGIQGSAKNRVMVSRRQSSIEESDGSSPSLTNGKRDPDLYKAVNEYYDRHPNGIITEKQYDSLFGAPEYVLRRASTVPDNLPLAPQKSGRNAPTIREFHLSIYWLLHNRKKYGFRHVCMLLLVISYTLLGAAMFFNIEAHYEHKVVAERKIALDKKIELIAEQILTLRNSSDPMADHSRAVELVKSAYVSLLEDESLYTGSTYYKSVDSANYKWTYSSAIFFSMNLYTTTGYGSIAPDSMLGRMCVIWYSLITIPITLVVIRDLGQMTLVYLTKLYAQFTVHFRRTMGYLEPHDDSMISLPIKFCLLLLAGYLFFTAIFIYFFDEWMGDMPKSGLPFFEAFYFAYISISTIGLGDIMPNNATFHPIISALFFFGMPVMKVVNRATYVFIENGVFGAFTLFESSIDRLTSKIEPRQEQPRSRKVSRCSYCSHLNEEVEENQATELLNNLTIRSLAAFARANADVYGGGFGRVNLRKGDLVQSRNNVNQNAAPQPS